MLAAAVRTRLAAEVPGLGGRVIGAADLAVLTAQNRLPQVTPAAAVVPLGMRGGAVTAVMSRFRQIVARRVGVVLVWRAPDPATVRAADDVEALAEAVVAALAGWTPDAETPGVLRLEDGALVALTGGTIRYDLVFVLDDQEETG